MTLPLTVEHALGLDDELPEIDWALPPAGVEPFDFEAPSGTLAAWRAGDPSAERVVLVPGATGSKEDFALLTPLLAESGYYVESYDLAGQYGSAAAGPAGADGWSYELFLDDMVAFLEAGRPAHLLGFSFAGIVAQLALLRHPGLVRSLTLLATPPLSAQVFRAVSVVGWLSRLPFVTARLIGWALIWNVRTNFSKVTPERLSFATARLALTRRVSVDGIVGLMMRAPDLRAQLREAGVPILVAAGLRDLWRPSLHRRFARQIGAELALYRTGHSPCETTPHQLAFDMLRTFAAAR